MKLVLGILGLLALVTLGCSRPSGVPAPSTPAATTPGLTRKCLPAQFFTSGPQYGTVLVGDTEICGNNLEFTTVYGPDYEATIKILQAEIDSLKAEIRRLKGEPNPTETPATPTPNTA